MKLSKQIKYCIIPLLLMVSLISNAQQYSNDWINFNQEYYKIKIASDGIYHLNYNTLKNQGFPVSSVNPLNIQLISRGVEQAIYIDGEGDGTLDPGDYIEFYGKGNDGWLDKQLYIDPSGHVNKDYSLFSDTAVYYLTWNSSSTANKRFNIINKNNYSNYTPSDYYIKHVRKEYTSHYLRGEPVSHKVTDPEYTAGEGWYDNPFGLGGSKTKNIPTNNTYASGPDAEVEFAVAGASDYYKNNTNVAPDHHLRVKFANITIDSLYDGYVLNQFNYNIPASSLSSAKTSFQFSSVNDLGSGADRNAISYIEIKYPHSTDLGGANKEYLRVKDASSQNHTRYDFSNFSASTGATVYLYDLTNGRRINVSRSGSALQVLVPNAGNIKKCLLTSTDNVKNINKLHPVSDSPNSYKFRDFSNSSADYIIISHHRLMKNSSSVQDYANYRNSTGYKTITVDVDQLYDQFAYGVHNHPLGIRNFVEYAWDNFSVKPEYLFLLGKGYRAANPKARRGNLYHDNLVPSMGDAPSDILFSSGIVDSLYQPALATGRLAARNTNHIDLYLNKVKEYDNARGNPKIWQKRILHFAGGSNTYEQNIIQNYLQSYAEIARDTFMGADIHTFYKTTTDPIQINKVDEIRSYINNGALLLTFFGHAAGIGFDISIDDPVTYSNKGKYPFLLANSCFAGDLFQKSSTSSEEWVLIEDKGVIGYLASITPGVQSELNVYSTSFYKNMSSKEYGSSFGKIIQETIKSIQNKNFNRKEICMAMTLHGDPAISFYNFNKPDYSIESANVSFKPPVVSTDRDTFKMILRPENLGRAINDTIIIEIKRTFGNKTQKKLIRTTAPHFNDTLSVKLPVSEESIGLNKFKVTLDSYNRISELSETNNSVTVNLDIKSANIIPVYPQDFAVVPGPDVTLKASTSNPFSETKDYVFQLDTTDQFNSPFMVSDKISSAGGVVEWEPLISMTDSMVYYWRVSLDSSYNGKYDWRSRSFQHVANKEGWAQAHFPQFKGNEYTFIKPDFNKRNFSFINVTNEITVKTGVYPNISWNNVTFRINNSIRRVWTCLNQWPDFIGVHFAVFDTLSGDIYKSYPQNNGNGLGQFNNVHCAGYPMATFEYFTNSTVGWGQYGLYEKPQSWWFDQIVNFIDSIPDGTPILAYSVQNHNAENYTNAMYKAFEDIGSAYIRTITNDQPYIIYGKKGASVGDAHEKVGLDANDKIILKDSIRSRWKEGYIKSPIIGPAQKWKSLHWDFSYSDSIPVDYVRLSVLGLKSDGSQDTVIHSLPPDSLNIHSLGNYVNAKEYPKIQLILRGKDDSLNTPPELEKWQVFYIGAPETAINPQEHFSFHNDTLIQGDTARLSVATENISNYDMDSLKVKYWVIDNDNIQHSIDESHLRPHSAGDILVDSVRFDTKNLKGLNNLWVEFNPDKDQPELTHINNIGEIPFFVKVDNSNPLLDVTFDGVHIMDGDIVSARPNIQITVNDENQYLAIDDTSNFSIFLKKPSDKDHKRVYFTQNGKQNMIFHPADLPKNKCKIEYNPELKEDGTYNLLIQAKDESGNKSGAIDYNVKFEVINKSTITNVMNWPNPFSTRTHFVFTLTGSRVPDYMKIQIMTVTGKVVREIEMHELGPIHIGRNITDYAWDGTDEYGDRLANGVYLYRVITEMNGQSIDKRSTKADKYFEKGFGKMYLIR